jgi:cell division protease FtsH
MVTLYGMSEELGLMAPANVTNMYLDGQSYLDCSQETSALVDKTVKVMLDKCFSEAVQTLTENRSLLNEIAEFLLLKETITGEELMKFINPAPPAEEPETTEA